MPDIPAEARETFEELARAPLVDPSELRAKIHEHLAAIEAAASHNEFLDLDLARAVAERCELLLTINPTSNDAAAHQIQAAVAYFVLSDDADDDLRSMLGFEDDAEVVNAILRELGLAEHCIELT